MPRRRKCSIGRDQSNRRHSDPRHRNAPHPRVPTGRIEPPQGWPTIAIRVEQSNQRLLCTYRSKDSADILAPLPRGYAIFIRDSTLTASEVVILVNLYPVTIRTTIQPIMSPIGFYHDNAG